MGTEIYDLLVQDHDEVKALLGKLVNLEESSDERSKVLEQIRDALIPHSRAEEAVFYNSLRSVPVIDEEAWHGYQEHMQAETLLRTLQVGDMVNAEFNKVAEKLKSTLEHHIKDEEGQLFTLAKGVVTPQEAEQMGKAFNELKAVVKKQSFLGTTFDMIRNMMPPRFSAAFEKGHKTLMKDKESAA